MRQGTSLNFSSIPDPRGQEAPSAVASGAGDSRYVRRNTGSAWGEATGTASRTALASYAGQTISNPPTQAEMQAVDDALKEHSRRLVALINDLRANGALSST